MFQDTDHPQLPFPPHTRWDVEGGKEAGIYTWFKEIDEELENGWVLSGSQKMLMLGGYSYLGLNKHPEISDSAIEAIKKFGTGMSGSRFLAGTTHLHARLEQKIAQLHQKDDALIYSSGYLANVSSIACLLGKNDYIVCDKSNHASILDGARYSQAKLIRYPHNDLNRLAEILQELPHSSRRLVITDGVFSMSGKVADIPEIARICRKHQALLMVDECHSMFVLGERGGGICDYFGMNPDDIDIIMATLSKSIPAAGGYITASEKVINYLRHESRGFIYSIALSSAMAATALKGLEVFSRERGPLVAKLRSNTELFTKTLKARGIETGNSATSITPIFVGNPIKAAVAARQCHEQGLYIHAVFPPVVPKDKAILRASITASHQEDDLRVAAGKIADIINGLNDSDLPEISGFNF